MNILSLKDLQENLATFDKNIFKIPLVLQYNKQDLAKEGIPLLSPEKLQNILNRQLKAPSFSASALTGENVVETMKKAIALTVSSLQEKLSIKQG
jgi:signal recognition particle receptor subunit beta